MWYQTVNPDPVEAVSSVVPGYHFHCPDVETVDQHIAELRRHLEPDSGLTPERKQASRRDIDQLLERRLYLMMFRKQAPGSGGLGCKAA